jgi:hypothetical protein
MTRNLRIISFMGKGRKLPMACGISFSFIFFRNPFFLSRFTIAAVGIVIHSPPVGILFVFPWLLLVILVCPESWLCLLMWIPRNLALLSLAFVMSVFSNDNSRLRSVKNVLIVSLSHLTSLLGPHTPISQS